VAVAVTVAIAVALSGAADLLDSVLNLKVLVDFEVLLDIEVSDSLEVIGSLDVLLQLNFSALGFDVEVDLKASTTFDLVTLSIEFSKALGFTSYLDILDNFKLNIILKFWENLSLATNFNVDGSLLLELTLSLKTNFDVGFHLDLTGSDTVTSMGLAEVRDARVGAIELLESGVLLSIEITMAVLGTMRGLAVTGSAGRVARILRSLGGIFRLAMATV
jgi:hypothetical protein